jgi:hypothetical protein
MPSASAISGPKSPRTAADIDSQTLPGEGLLEDALPDVAGEEERIRTLSTHRRNEAQLGDAQVLGLIHDREVERRALSCGDGSREPL